MVQKIIHSQIIELKIEAFFFPVFQNHWDGNVRELLLVSQDGEEIG
jgi:hypothetical protein